MEKGSSKTLQQMMEEEPDYPGIPKADFSRLFVRRRMSLSIENNKIGDGIWWTSVAKTLRDLADYMEETEGVGGNLLLLRTKDGNKLTVLFGSDYEELLLGDNPHQAHS